MIAGVANMHELGSGSTGAISVYGPAHNPWDTERCPGGSSSGPAAAVAGGLVAGAVGADGLGSIRYPAAYCGLTGLKPTFGRSAMEGHHIAEQTETIVSGPLCRDAADARLLASVLFGARSWRPASPAALPDRRGPRPATGPTASAEVAEACEPALDALRERGRRQRRPSWSCPSWTLFMIAAILVAQSEEAAELTPAKLNALDRRAEPDQPRPAEAARRCSPRRCTARASAVRALARRAVAEIFEQVDVLAWPTTPAAGAAARGPDASSCPSGPTSADAEQRPPGDASPT